MNNHAPENYVCPICLGVKQSTDERTMIRPLDIVYQDDQATAFIGSFFVGNNSGQVIVVPNQHYENIYDLPDEIGSRIFALAKQMALAIRATYDCQGITTVQNNEPVGGQHAFHYHLHVFPRYEGDKLHANMTEKRASSPAERQPYAEKLRHYLAKVSK